MNITALLALSLSVFHKSGQEIIERLSSEAYNSRSHSIRQIYRVNYHGDAVDHESALLPSIRLQGVRGAKWPIESAMLVVETTKSAFRLELENLLQTIVDAEKLFVVVNLDFHASGLIIEQIGRILFRRGVLNYCVITASSSVVSISKFDIILNRLVAFDPETPFEELFPPLLRTLAGRSVKALFSDNFPYAYKLGRNWDGIDVYLLNLARDRFRCRVNRTVLEINRSNALDRMEMVQTLLENGSVDIHIPRAYYTRVNSGLGLAPAYEWDSLVLVVPKSDQLNLSNIMLQPFSGEVWTLICGYFLIKKCIKLLTFLKRQCTKLHKATSAYRLPNSFWTVTGVGVELVSFLLIEAYLAKITEFLLYSRFKKDPRTLEEFFRSDTLVVIPEYMDTLVATFEPPEVAEKLRAKMVRPSELSLMPVGCCARIHTLPRAEYIIRSRKNWNVDVGRRQLYILPGSLKTIPMSYLLGSKFTFKNSFEQFLLRAYESGMMTQYINSQRESVALLERNFVSKGWLTLADLYPLFLLVACGWCLSAVTFGLEMLFLKAHQYVQRNDVTTFRNRKKCTLVTGKPKFPHEP